MKSAAAALLAAVLLSGCALPRMIDSEVQSFGGATPPAASARFEFDRLPSQQGSAQQDVVESLASVALQKAGLRPVGTANTADKADTPGTAGDASPIYKVQVQVQISQIANPRATAPRSSVLWGWNEREPGSLGFMMVMEPPWFRHAVQIVLRERTSNAVVYETSASFDGPWSDSRNLLPPIMEAALRDYPNAVSSPRKVVIELPPPIRQP